MLIDKNFVKRLAACEIMGCVNSIITHKCGVLTMDKLTVFNIWAGKTVPIKINEEKYDFRETFKNEKHFQLFT
jgi:magnesium-transporting ATPase (P-type)